MLICDMAICADCGDRSTLNGSLGLCQRCYARELRRRKRRKTRACSSCGTEFVTTRRDARFCSDACRQRAFRQRHHQDRSRHLITDMAGTPSAPVS
jgi:hypothetical protein